MNPYEDDSNKFDLNKRDTSIKVRELFQDTKTFQEVFFNPLNQKASKEQDNPMVFWEFFDSICSPLYRDGEQLLLLLKILLDSDSNWKNKPIWNSIKEEYNKIYKKRQQAILNAEKQSNRIFEDEASEISLEEIIAEFKKYLPSKELHLHIFKDNAFELWEHLFKRFDIKQSSRTDVKFIYEEMKREAFIHKTISQKHFLEWITDTYEGLIIEKTSNHSRTKERLAIYSNVKAQFKLI